MSEPVALLNLLEYFGITQELREIVGDWEINFHPLYQSIPYSHTGTLANLCGRDDWRVPEERQGLDLLITIKKKGDDVYGTLRVQVKTYRSEITQSDVSNILLRRRPTECPPEVSGEKLSVGLLLCTGSVEPRVLVLTPKMGDPYLAKRRVHRIRQGGLSRSYYRLQHGFLQITGNRL